MLLSLRLSGTSAAASAGLLESAGMLLEAPLPLWMEVFTDTALDCDDVDFAGCALLLKDLAGVPFACPACCLLLPLVAFCVLPCLFAAVVLPPAGVPAAAHDEGDARHSVLTFYYS